MRLLFILGSNPDLSKKEIEAAATILPLLWSSSMLRPGVLELKSAQALPFEIGGIAGYLSSDNVNLRESISALQARLGGTIQIVLLWQQTTLRDAPTVVANALETVPAEANRWKLAVRTIGGTIDAERLALQVKRELKLRSLTLRYLPSRSGVAGVFHENLDLNRFDLVHPGLELTVIPEGKGLWLGVTLTVQDIEEYSRRDFGIPVPDPTSGMLPPKLAQIMINLGISGTQEGSVLYDPFCGNGRIVLEAVSMGLAAFGSDSVPEKVAASQANLKWLHGERSQEAFWQADATQPASVEALRQHAGGGEVRIIAEPYLGRPLRSPLQASGVSAWMRELGELYVKFFETWKSSDVESMLIVFPSARQAKGGEASLLDFLFDRLVQIGYAPKRLAQYARPDAIVARDLVQLTKSSSN